MSSPIFNIASGTIGTHAFGSGAITSGYTIGICEVCKTSLLSDSFVVVYQPFVSKRFCHACAGFGSWDNPFGRKGDTNFLVASDWLEEHGYKEAAAELRKVVG